MGQKQLIDFYVSTAKLIGAFNFRHLDHDAVYDFLAVLRQHEEVYTTGIGKSAHVARYMADILSSIGKRCHFIDPISGVHGDIGRIVYAAPIIVFTNSGETPELVPFVEAVYGSNNFVFVTGQEDYSLKKYASISINLGPIAEGNRLGFPGASIVKATAFCAAITSALVEQTNVSEKEYKSYHPGGAIGKRLSEVRESTT